MNRGKDTLCGLPVKNGKCDWPIRINMESSGRVIASVPVECYRHGWVHDEPEPQLDPRICRPFAESDELFRRSSTCQRLK